MSKPKRAREKTPRSEFEPLNKSDMAMLGSLPAGIPTLGLHWGEIQGYLDSYKQFRAEILSGHLSNTFHCWRVIARFKDADGIPCVLVDEYGDEVNDEEDEIITRFLADGTASSEGHFVIDEAFIVKAWIIGVHRGGFFFADGYDDYKDLAMQCARYGFRNQG